MGQLSTWLSTSLMHDSPMAVLGVVHVCRSINGSPLTVSKGYLIFSATNTEPDNSLKVAVSETFEFYAHFL